MSILFRRTFKFGPYRANVSKAGVSHTVKIGRWSYNSRARRHRVDLPGPFAWQSAKRPRRTRRRIGPVVVFVLVLALGFGGVWVWQRAAGWVDHRQQQRPACTAPPGPPPASVGRC